MRISVPKEIMNNEHRVALTPTEVRTLVTDGHELFIESGAGSGASFPDEEYVEAGGTIVDSADETWTKAELLLKVKEPLESEYKYLRSDLTVFTYLHLAADRPLTEALTASKTTSIAYETVTDHRGTLPLLTPMSQVAGRLAVIEGSHHLLSTQGGRGLLVSGIPGTQPARVVVIGGGQVGASAVAMALGLRAEVTVLDVDPHVLQRFDDQYAGGVRTLISDPSTLDKELEAADLVIGAVLIPGAAAPKLVREDTVKKMKEGAVLVDVAIDQGGCFENSRKTSHDEPTFEVHNTLFYCVANMPGAVANTSARALASATLPYIRAVAKDNLDAAIERFPGLRSGVMTRGGKLLSEPVRQAFDWQD
ncbi:alanine dehydrogenase [Corynebacterium macginleyi]|uniref:alanine dehydrogenase n=1 Tax=Corynebacterium macginleyi TaxID=38290 RepID=UPI00190E42FA|nr:alanine dehydrogenase [Corynebacterium macginleyi]MBK4141365.1 alanine dehydrogenase [Corynebacterium macginleyi]MBK4149142.1 alanine dehydrogenase [Corynebacterium macginleyi]MBK4159573.1 alanine dehydrogenase [Corynebacterium macginleyi]MBK4164367.1 alanine dehydrogenase [Corynebacterium macginleyi]MBK4178480.1 alanine dehydrogenase [Corynebacterium macginleyi]